MIVAMKSLRERGGRYMDDTYQAVCSKLWLQLIICSIEEGTVTKLIMDCSTAP